MSLRDTIKAAQDIDKETVDIPKWGVKIEVRSMSAKARARMVGQAIKGDIDYAAIAIATCYDPETGEPAFSVEDTDWLNDKSGGPLEKLATVGMRLSGLTEEALDTGKGES